VREALIARTAGGARPSIDGGEELREVARGGSVARDDRTKVWTPTVHTYRVVEICKTCHIK
jgi:hypothetical protein